MRPFRTSSEYASPRPPALQEAQLWQPLLPLVQNSACSFFMTVLVAKIAFGSLLSRAKTLLSSNYSWVEHFACRLTSDVIHTCLWGVGGAVSVASNNPKIGRRETEICFVRNQHCLSTENPAICTQSLQSNNLEIVEAVLIAAN